MTWRGAMKSTQEDEGMSSGVEEDKGRGLRESEPQRVRGVDVEGIWTDLHSTRPRAPSTSSPPSPHHHNTDPPPTPSHRYLLLSSSSSATAVTLDVLTQSSPPVFSPPPPCVISSFRWRRPVVFQQSLC